ncbi:hypothetical protein AI2BBH_05830 [Alistipes indistinctus]|nr:hypothetical protein AI2BBH_05830 [Alistipes indistinctus]
MDFPIVAKSGQASGLNRQDEVPGGNGRVITITYGLGYSQRIGGKFSESFSILEMTHNK